MNGKLIIFSAPSGSGKTTIVKHLLEKDLPLEFSISACTREPRPGEQDGRDYYFFPVEVFKKKIEQGEFIEWEEVYENQYYGTLRSEVNRIWKNNNHVVFDVDVAGGIHLKQQFKKRALAVFIMPPSMEELRKRLEKRSAGTHENIGARLYKAGQEMEFADRFDVTIVNDDLDTALSRAYETVKKFLEKNN